MNDAQTLAAECANCDGVKCMDCRLRHWHDECREDCPECCDPPPMEEYVPKSALDAKDAEIQRLRDTLQDIADDPNLNSTLFRGWAIGRARAALSRSDTPGEAG